MNVNKHMKYKIIISFFIIAIIVGACLFFLFSSRGYDDTEYGKDLLWGENGVEQNDSAAFVEFEKLVNRGNPYAKYFLGICCEESKGVNENYTKANELFKEAISDLTRLADKKDADAQRLLGHCYYYGKGVEQNKVAAVKWYRLAAELGNTNAQHDLGTCYHNGEGVKQDFKEAVKWHRCAAEQGMEVAQYNLGCCYYNGEGIGKNYTEAVKLFKLAAKQGNVNAKSILNKIGK